MNCERKCVEIAVQQGIMVREPKLVIRSLPDGEGKIHIEPFAALRVAAGETGRSKQARAGSEGNRIIEGGKKTTDSRRAKLTDVEFV